MDGPLVTDLYLFTVPSSTHPFKKPTEFGTVLGARYSSDSVIKRNKNLEVFQSVRRSQTALRANWVVLPPQVPPAWKTSWKKNTLV